MEFLMIKYHPQLIHAAMWSSNVNQDCECTNDALIPFFSMARRQKGVYLATFYSYKFLSNFLSLLTLRLSEPIIPYTSP
jgi:hypothetical protein